MIKTYSEFIRESFDSGFGLSIVFVNNSGKKITDERMFKSLEDARKFMIDLANKNSGGYIEYFDICSGYNYSEPKNLKVWGGEGGYFYNVLNLKDKDSRQFSRREFEMIERCEVDINEYLGF